jgi:hypothetical protein
MAVQCPVADRADGWRPFIGRLAIRLRTPWKGSPMAQRSVDLRFINDDVREQLTQSRRILDVAETLKSITVKIEDAQVKAKIEESIRDLLDIASKLTTNANKTSNVAVITVSSSIAPSS